MSKMKDLYIEMVGVAMDYIINGFDDSATSQALEKEFGIYFTKYHDTVISAAKTDVAAYHRDMMNSVHSHEEIYG